VLVRSIRSCGVGGGADLSRGRKGVCILTVEIAGTRTNQESKAPNSRVAGLAMSHKKSLAGEEGSKVTKHDVTGDRLSPIPPTLKLMGHFHSRAQARSENNYEILLKFFGTCVTCLRIYRTIQRRPARQP